MLRVYYKGQPDLILDKCTRFVNHDGKPSEMFPFLKKQIQDRIAHYGAKGKQKRPSLSSLHVFLFLPLVESYKLIFFAYKDLDYDPT